MAKQMQTVELSVDRPCIRCAYNLRGQTAVWDWQSMKWRCTCPECGQPQDVTLAAETEQPVFRPLLLCILFAALLWLSWFSLSELSGAFARLLATPPAAYNSALRRPPVTPNPNASLDIFDMDMDAVKLHVGLRGFRVLLPSVLLGALVSLAPYARPSQRRTLLLILLTAVALTAFSQTSDSRLATQDSVNALRILYGGNPLLGISEPSPRWIWLASMEATGFILAGGGAMLGLWIGKPVTRLVTHMFLSPTLRPELFRW